MAIKLRLPSLRKKDSAAPPYSKKAADMVSTIVSRAKSEKMGDLRKMESASSNVKQWYPTGIPVLDVIVSGYVGKGLPSGRIVELYGPESVGKTTLGCAIMRSVQGIGGFVEVIDTESALTRERVIQLGVSPEALVYNEAQYLEDIMDHLSKFLKKYANSIPCMIFWDTFASTDIKKEAGYAVGETSLGAHARIMSQGLRRMVKNVAGSQLLLIICNQMKTGGIGNIFATEGERDATLGGRALRFHSEMRIKIRIKSKIMGPPVKGSKKQSMVGEELVVSLSKNKQLVKHVECRMVLLRGHVSVPMSTFRTFDAWGYVNTGRLKVGAKSYTESQFVKQYEADENFRDRTDRALEKAFKAIYGVSM